MALRIPDAASQTHHMRVHSSWPCQRTKLLCATEPLADFTERVFQIDFLGCSASHLPPLSRCEDDMDIDCLSLTYIRDSRYIFELGTFFISGDLGAHSSWSYSKD